MALARRNVCGPPGSETDRACAVVSHEGAGGIHRVVIDRAPPAGGVAGDRVRVTLRGHGSQVEVEPVDAAAPPRP